MIAIIHGVDMYMEGSSLVWSDINYKHQNIKVNVESFADNKEMDFNAVLDFGGEPVASVVSK